MRCVGPVQQMVQGLSMYAVPGPAVTDPLGSTWSAWFGVQRGVVPFILTQRCASVQQPPPCRHLFQVFLPVVVPLLVALNKAKVPFSCGEENMLQQGRRVEILHWPSVFIRIYGGSVFGNIVKENDSPDQIIIVTTGVVRKVGASSQFQREKVLTCRSAMQRSI